MMVRVRSWVVDYACEGPYKDARIVQGCVYVCFRKVVCLVEQLLLLLLSLSVYDFSACAHIYTHTHT